MIHKETRPEIPWLKIISMLICNEELETYISNPHYEWKTDDWTDKWNEGI